jgi:anaerobic selenocysteine-containing dehydrogenase
MKHSEQEGPFTLTRRQVLKAGGLIGAGALLGDGGYQLMNWQQSAPENTAFTYPLALPENILYTTCLQCNTQCTLKAKLQNEVLVKIDGNPYSPMNLVPQLSFSTSTDDAARVDGSICSKGQAGVQTLYDPYRLRKVLKRAGPRGSGRWKTIPFEQAIQEITEGGKLFADIGEDRVVPGFKDIFALRDPKVAKSMAADVQAIRAGKMTVSAFQGKYQAYLDTLIDPAHPDLGPKNNQFVFMGGRISPDRETFAQRFTYNSIGSVNWYGHTTICEQAHHVAFQYATAQWDSKLGWVKGTNHMKPDYTRAEFVIFWGTGFNEANFGPPPMSARISQAIVDTNLKIAVIDPRLSKSAAKGWWIPVKPGGDLALALGMLSWIVQNGRYDAAFLRNANTAAATASGEKSWTNATWLVKPATGKFLRASEIGIGTDTQFVALVGGKPVAVDPNETTTPVIGDLDVATTIHTIPVKSSFRLLKEMVTAQSLDFYAQESGIDLATLTALAQEFTAHGKKAAIDFYRGPIKLTYGYYAAQAIIALNYLIGNVDHVGGLVPGGGAWDGTGAKPGQPFPLLKLHPGALTPFGIKNTRESSGPYETSTLFKRDGYPARRPWFPFTNDVYQEIIPAAAAGYPYPIQILWLHYGTPALATPAGHLQIGMLRDTGRIPLFIATDVVIGESSMYADYLFPDLSYLERWSNPISTSPVVLTKTSKFRQPVVAPIPEIVSVDGEAMPISMDAVMIAVAKQLGASGFGANGFAPGSGLNRPEDYYLKMIANLAAGDKPGDSSPPADAAELALFRQARQHLPAAVFDEAKWQAAVGPYWEQVVYLLNRGGRFEQAAKAYSGAFVTHAWGKLLDLYVEPVGAGKHSVTSQRFSGVPQYQGLQHMDGSAVIFPAAYNLELFTYKEIWGGQSRTGGNYVGQLALMPENFIYLNAQDAQQMGLVEGNVVQLQGPDFTGQFEVGPGGQTSVVQGRVKIVQGLRPGAVSVSWHFGHWAYGARDVVIDGQTIHGEAMRGRGLVPNPAMAVDAYLKDVTLTDPIAGDAVYSGSKVRLVKVAEGDTTAMPVTGYMSMGPRLALTQPADATYAAWAAEQALHVARGQSDASALQTAVAQKLGLSRKTH